MVRVRVWFVVPPTEMGPKVTAAGVRVAAGVAVAGLLPLSGSVAGELGSSLFTETAAV